MNWNTENVDPIGDLCRMKEAIESAPTHKVYVNPIDMLNFEQAGIFKEKTFIFVNDDVPLGYVMVDNTLIDIDYIMALRPHKTPSICSDTGKQNDLSQQRPKNRAERRKAMKQRKRGKMFNGNI